MPHANARAAIVIAVTGVVGVLVMLGAFLELLWWRGWDITPVRRIPQGRIAPPAGRKCAPVAFCATLSRGLPPFVHVQVLPRVLPVDVLLVTAHPWLNQRVL